jgi:hypothetical protein
LLNLAVAHESTVELDQGFNRRTYNVKAGDIVMGTVKEARNGWEWEITFPLGQMTGLLRGHVGTLQEGLEVVKQAYLRATGALAVRKPGVP